MKRNSRLLPNAGTGGGLFGIQAIPGIKSFVSRRLASDKEIHMGSLDYSIAMENLYTSLSLNKQKLRCKSENGIWRGHLSDSDML
jgi:hypothetical protein